MSRSERKKQAQAEKAQAKAEKAKTKGKKLARFKAWFAGLKTWKKALLIGGTTLLVLILIVGGIAFAYLNSLYEEIHEPTPEDYDLSLVDVDGYYNILLLGVDSRDMDNIKGTRSDAIMVVSINAETNDVKILSVYRDTYLKMGDTSTFDKATHACAYGGPEMTMKTLNQALDLNISDYVVVNFKAVADLVDAVGGIEVEVEEYEIQQLNKYTIETAENIGRKKYKLVEEPGLQTLEGVQAVSYGRIRKGVGDDFKRTERMRTVITLVAEKMKTMSFGDLRDIIDMMTPQVQTNLSMGNILGLAIRLPQYNIIGTDGWPYNVSTGYIGQASYVFPSDLASNVVKLHQEFFAQEDYVPSATVYSISSAIAQRIEAERNAGNIEGEKEEQIDTSQEGPGTGTQPGGEGGSGQTGGQEGGGQGGTGGEQGGESGEQGGESGQKPDGEGGGTTGGDQPGGSEGGGTTGGDQPGGGEGGGTTGGDQPGGNEGGGTTGGTGGQTGGNEGGQTGAGGSGTAGSQTATSSGTTGGSQSAA